MRARIPGSYPGISWASVHALAGDPVSYFGGKRVGGLLLAEKYVDFSTKEVLQAPLVCSGVHGYTLHMLRFIPLPWT